MSSATTDKKIFTGHLSQEVHLVKIKEHVTKFQKVKQEEEKQQEGAQVIQYLKANPGSISEAQISELETDFGLLKKVVKDLSKDVKKLEKELKKRAAAEERRRQEEQALAAVLTKVSWDDMVSGKVSHGVSPMHQSDDTGYSPKFTEVSSLSAASAPADVVVRARVHTSRAVGKQGFMLLRYGMYSIQAVVAVDDNHSEELLAFMKAIPKESVVDVYATLNVPQENITSATQQDIELHINRIYIISMSEKPTPVNVQDCMLSEEKLKEQGMNAVSQSIRLDHRYLDVRAPAHVAIFRIQSAIGMLFREFLYSNGFTEIHSPKLIATASEGGANVFKLDYFGRDAYLAQSPQLYKQMAVQSDLLKVFEIGPVFRAENSNTHRHLCEFVGLDMEMPIQNHYHEVLHTLDNMFVHIFDGLKTKFAKELEIINEQYPFEPLKYRPAGKNLIITYPEGMKMLREAGEDVSDFEDMTTPQEKKLGKIIKEKYDTDFYIMDKFPMTVRPFYTMPDPKNDKLSNSYDLFIRGEEISSGAQRIHDADFLLKKAEEKDVNLEPIMDYVKSFRYGGWPHGGAGVGLERVVMLYLGIGNVRRSTLFPRTPDRLTP